MAPDDLFLSTLVAQIRGGHRHAFDTLAHRYAEPLLRFAYTILGDHALAEDVVQDVLFWVWANRETLDPTHPIGPYLFRAVANKARNTIAQSRNRGRLEGTHGTTIANLTVGNSIPADDSVHHEYTDADLWAVVNTLPENYRTALHLRYIDQRSHADIATILGVTDMAAKKLVYRALAELRKRFS